MIVEGRKEGRSMVMRTPPSHSKLAREEQFTLEKISLLLLLFRERETFLFLSNEDS